MSSVPDTLQAPAAAPATGSSLISVPLAATEASLAAFPPTERYINRERSWLTFNERVLEEATNPRHPLFERLRFLGISDSNLDEFYAVRVAGLKGRLEAGVSDLTYDGLSVTQQLLLIHVETQRLLKQQQEIYEDLRAELAVEGIHIINSAELEPDEQEWLQGHFVTQVMPVITPLACDPAHPFPLIPNDGLCMVLRLKDNKKNLMSIIPVPQSLPRFIKLEPSGRFLPLEQAIPLFFDRLLPNFKVRRCGLFHVIRDSEMEMELTEGFGSLVEVFLTALKGRRRGHVIRLTFSSQTSDDLREFIEQQLQIESGDEVYECDGMLNLSDLEQLIKLDRPELKFPRYDVRFPERIKDWRGDYFAAIGYKDFVVHHPYESFDVVVEFLRQAARDPDVLAIKQTLYRTSKVSAIVRALVEAAEAGKAVTVVVELKARFDEEANIRLAYDLERAGAQIVYGFVDKKCHAKVTLVLRREAKGLKGYAHFGTGNYHPVTAKTYTDLSFFTCDDALVRDAAKLFNYLTGYAVPDRQEKMAFSPITLKATLLQLINDEINHARAGRPAQIWAKMNSLVDPEICDALYRASQAGVEIEMVVRGICCLRPGVPGLSDNIRVKSIVGRFLEHSRVLCFGNGYGLPHKKARVDLTSADWMPRNFHARIETMVPIEQETVHAQMLEQVMIANLKDTRQSWYLQADGTYQRHPEADGFSAHEYFMTNPSLSGRGKSRKKGKQAQHLSLELKRALKEETVELPGVGSE